MPQLATKLASEGFDGAVRFVRGTQLGFALFSRGRRLLDVFGHGWPDDPSKASWETWLSAAGASVSVEDRRTVFPSMTFRRQLHELPLDVVRGRPSADAQVRSDTRADAAALELRPHAPERGVRLDSTVQALVDADPAVGVVRWVLVDLAFQFEQFRRTSRWRALVEPLDAIETVTLHHDVHVAQSLHPKAMRAHLELYKAVVLGRSALPRLTRERIAVVVSSTNRCAYCVAHHAAALRSLADEPALVAALAAGEVPAELGSRDHTLLSWARRATLDPASNGRDDLEALRAAGLDDDAILDAVLTVGYFCFVNRIVLLLGVDLESDHERSCT